MKRSKRLPRWIGVALLAAALSGVQAQEAAPEQEPAPAPEAARLYLERGCVGCHGEDGRTPLNANYPKIAGQTEAYLYNQMRDIKSRQRDSVLSPLMSGIMAGVSEEEIKRLAEWLAAR